MEGAEVVARFLACLFVYMAVEAMNERRRSLLSFKKLLLSVDVTSLLEYIQSAPSKPQAPARSLSGPF